MKTNLPLGGMDLPSEETCVRFAARSVWIAERVRRICRHFSPSLRATLIQAGLLHQCWARQVKLRTNGGRSAPLVSPLPRVDALAITQRHSAGVYSVECSDEQQYRVILPLSGKETALATQLLCLETAHGMGLPVSPVSLILLNRGIAANAGIQRDCRTTCLSKDAFCPCGQVLCCLGIREFEKVKVGPDGRPKLPLSPRAVRYTVGRMVFDLLVLNTIPEVPAFRNVNGRAEPLFGDFGHSLLDADWPRFLRATYRERVPLPQVSTKIRSFEQLEVWIRRVDQVNLDAISEPVFKLPSYWYNNRPTLVSAIVSKLSERRRDLRGIIHYLVKSGHFPGIQKSMHREQPANLQELSSNVHNLTEFRLLPRERRLVR